MIIKASMLKVEVVVVVVLVVVVVTFFNHNFVNCKATCTLIWRLILFH